MSRPPWDTAPRRVLLIQLRRIGDVVLATPMLDAVRAAWPGARTSFLTSSPAGDLFAGDDRIDLLWTLRERRGIPLLARRLRAEQFDLVLDLQSLSLTALLSLAAGGYRVGFRRRFRHLAYDRAVDHGAHQGTDFAADHKLDLLRAVGVAPRLTPPRLPVPVTAHPAWAAAEDRPRVILTPVSPRGYKRWAPEAFGNVARSLSEVTGAWVLVAGGPGEEDQLAAAAGNAGSPSPTVIACRSLPEFASILTGADILVGNDNGPRHIAIALGVPTVAWFGPQNPSNWTPPADPRHVAAQRKGATSHRLRPDLTLVPDTVDAVSEAARGLLAGGRISRQAREASAFSTAVVR